jgi:hypothetical protein
VDAARGPSFAADQDEGSQRGSRRPVPPLVPKIQVTTTNEGARAQGGLTPDFLALSTCDRRAYRVPRAATAWRADARRGRPYRLDCLNRAITSSLVPARFHLLPGLVKRGDAPCAWTAVDNSLAQADGRSQWIRCRKCG